MNAPPLIRRELPEDIPGIHAVVRAAFGQPAEANLVDGLRRAGALTLSAVAAVGARIEGHVGFSPIIFGERHSGLALAPIAVAPACQRQGIGTALIRWSLDECRQLGHAVVIVVGSPGYYSRFGFAPASPLGIQCPFPVPPKDFMLLELSPGAAREYAGRVSYHPEFDRLST